MSKKKSSIENWDEVGILLKEMADCQVYVNRLEAKMNGEISDIKERYGKMSGESLEKIDSIRENILLFVAEHKKEFTDTKSREFTFGRVGLRKSTEIITRNVKAIMEALKAHGMQDCINVKESINKDVLKNYTDEKIESVGAKRRESERAYLEINLEKLKKE